MPSLTRKSNADKSYWRAEQYGLRAVLIVLDFPVRRLLIVAGAKHRSHTPGTVGAALIVAPRTPCIIIPVPLGASGPSARRDARQERCDSVLDRHADMDESAVLRRAAISLRGRCATPPAVKRSGQRQRAAMAMTAGAAGAVGQLIGGLCQMFGVGSQAL